MGSAPSSSIQSPPPQPISSSITSSFSVFIIIVQSGNILGTLYDVNTWKSAYNGSNSITTSTNGNGINVVTDLVGNGPAVIIVPDTIRLLGFSGGPGIKYTVLLVGSTSQGRSSYTEQFRVRAYLVRSGQYKLAYVSPSSNAVVASGNPAQNIDNSIKPSNNPSSVLVFNE